MSKKSIAFEEARSFSRKLGLKSYTDWRKYCNSGNKPIGIPCEPSHVYKHKGWISYSDWLNYVGPSKDIFSRKYYVNHDFFKVWSPDMAYILGFWWADGCMPRNKKYFNILVQERDGYLLQNMLTSMGSNYKVYTVFKENKFYKYIAIYSPEINKDIEKLGGCPNKSKIIGFPNVPKKYTCDFIRGYWDGDGTIVKRKGKASYISKAISASSNFIYGLEKSLKENIKDISPSIYVETRLLPLHKNRKLRAFGKYYTLYLNGKNTKRFCKFLYPTNVNLRLERKMKLFKEHCAAYIEQRGIEVKFVKYNEAQKFAKNNSIFSKGHWFRFCKSSKFPLNVPKNPREVYKRGWIGWRHFLGTTLLYKTNYSNKMISSR